MQFRPGSDRFQPQRHARVAWRDRLSAVEAHGEHDPLGRDDFQDLAGGLGAVRIADPELTAGTWIDGWAGPPPGCPSFVMREKAKHDVPRSLNDDGAIEAMGKFGHRCFLLPLFSRRPGRGPRRDCSSWAASFSRHKALFHMRSRISPTGPRASRRAL